MQRLPLDSTTEAHFCVSGNVVIHPSAVIAPGVLLQADAGSQLVVAAGACIGMGSVLHVCTGTLEIGAEAIVGAGVLIVGQGQIGAKACIGAMTTIVETSIDAQTSVPPGSLIGDRSRQVAIDQPPAEPASSAHTPPVSNAAPSASPPETNGAVPNQPAASGNEPDASSDAPGDALGDASSDALAEMQQIYGQAYLERIMITLFPHRKPLDS